jgi:hypothetical protein
VPVSDHTTQQVPGPALGAGSPEFAVVTPVGASGYTDADQTRRHDRAK